MATNGEHNEQGNLVYLAFLTTAGLVLGVGLLHLLWSFGYEGGPLNQNISEVGFSGIDNIWLLRPADYSIGLIVAGALTMVVLNAMAWKHTDGY